jgi:hypothetical protein
VNFEAILIVYGATILLTRFVSADTSNPSWQVAVTAALGIAWALQPTPPAGQKVAVRLTSFIAFAFLLGMAFAACQLFVLLVSTVFVTYGLRGLLTGRIVLAGRVGAGREYRGMAAYLQSALCLVFGAAGVAFALVPSGVWHP